VDEGGLFGDCRRIIGYIGGPLRDNLAGRAKSWQAGSSEIEPFVNLMEPANQDLCIEEGTIYRINNDLEYSKG